MAFDLSINFDRLVKELTPSFLRDDTISIKNGDIELNEGQEENDEIIEHIIRANKGDFKWEPVLGYGVETKLSGIINTAEEKKNIRKELKRDEFNINKVEIKETDTDEFSLFVDATKKN
jgi:transcriptional/translational regulatory protein YebC/TACO1